MTLQGAEAEVEIDTAIFAAVLSVPNALTRSSSILTLPLFTIAARARKLKKLRETDFCSRELDFFLLIDATNLLNRTTLTEFRNVF